jgi:methylated-DNA-protein-cysteine methyltransferase-like protein
MSNTQPSAQRPRQVGVCLKHLSSDTTHTFHDGNVPWQRVINSKGIISPRGHPSGAANQAVVLRGEGVTVSTGSLGELCVDLGTYGWFPKQLPSEVAAGIAPPVDSDEEAE